MRSELRGTGRDVNGLKGRLHKVWGQKRGASKGISNKGQKNVISYYIVIVIVDLIFFTDLLLNYHGGSLQDQLHFLASSPCDRI